jgi:hypothetical protein
MKSWLWKAMFAATIALPALSGVARAQSTDNDGCTNATLSGDYAFSVTNFTLPSVGVGIKTFDGKGQFTQEDYIGDSLRKAGVTSFRTGETGTYKVNPDCTGSAEIQLNVLNVLPGTSHGEIHNVIVISDGGRSVHGVVAGVTSPGQPIGTLSPGQTRVDFWKVASEEDN